MTGRYGQAAKASAPEPKKPPTQGDEWAPVRGEFELSPDWVHLAGFLLASHPRRVRDAIERHRQELDKNPALYLEGKVVDHQATLEPAARYMGVAPDEIALTDSTTMGLGTLYAGMPLDEDAEVLTTAHDHYSTHESLRLACERSGASLRKVPLYDRGAKATVVGMASAIEKNISEKTRVVAVTWVHSSTGVKTPIAEIAQVVAKANEGRAEQDRITFCVDGVHGFGVDDVTMAALGCDFFVAGTHKWMFGPRGTGLIWGKRDYWKMLRPTIPHFGMAAYGAWIKDAPPPPTTADMMTPGGFHSFEHRWAVGEAFEFHLELGKAKIERRIVELNRQCKEGLAQMKHVTLHTPVDHAVSAGIVTFEVEGREPKAVVEHLHAKKIVASTTPYAVSYARLAPAIFNSPADVEQALSEIRNLA